MTAPNTHLMTGAYALDALDGDEFEQFQAHLGECDSCPTEVTELRATAARLVALVERTPPVGLRERVLREVDRTAQLPPLPISLADRRPRRRVMAAVGVALAAAAVAAGALLVVVSNDQLDTQDVIAAADSRTLTAEVEGGGTAELVFSPSQDAAVMRLEDSPPPPEGKTYQAWVLEDDTAVPANTFEPSADGVVELLVEDADAATGFAVTIEDDGGSPTGQPTTDPIVAFDIAGA